jgi:hypothetical protein
MSYQFIALNWGYTHEKRHTQTMPSVPACQLGEESQNVARRTAQITVVAVVMGKL